MMNAGKYNHRIVIYATQTFKDAEGFQHKARLIVLEPYASVRTVRGMTLIKNDTSFEKAYTNFTIRYPKHVRITRDMIIEYRGIDYRIEYINNVNGEGVELELQAKEVTH